MKFLPIENIIFKSNLNEDEIIERLTNEVEFENTYINYVSGKLFDGEIVGNKFEIIRKIKYRNSCLPKIIGFIEKDTDGTKITVNMKLHKGITIFSYIWFGFLVFMCIMFLSTGFYEFHPFTMIIFGYIFIISSFKYESFKSKKLLKNIFQAEIISE
ncbi:MAG: hypothetical protein ACEQSR_05815 [Candidatus Methylacidiphilales bacterium]